MSKITLTLCSLILAILIFGSGVFVGREHPAHHFEKISQVPYLYDTTTGKLCNLNETVSEQGARNAPNTPTNADGYPMLNPRPEPPNCPR